jgi:hypothetical protein
MCCKTNKDSCVLDSFAYVTKLSALELMAAIGHDGAGTGFHTQELIPILLQRGFTVTPIELFPTGIKFDGSLKFYPSEQRFQWLLKLLPGTRGVFTGLNPEYQPHAVAWEVDRIFDPADNEYKELLCWTNNWPSGFDESVYIPQCFWLVEKRNTQRTKTNLCV